MRITRTVAAVAGSVALAAGLSACYVPGASGDPTPLSCTTGDDPGGVLSAPQLQEGQRSCNDGLPGLTDTDWYRLTVVLPGSTVPYASVSCDQIVGSDAEFAVVNLSLSGGQQTLATGTCDEVSAFETAQLPLEPGVNLVRVFHPETSGEVELNATLEAAL
jgi:hypothetical protein